MRKEDLLAVAACEAIDTWFSTVACAVPDSLAVDAGDLDAIATFNLFLLAALRDVSKLYTVVRKPTKLIKEIYRCSWCTSEFHAQQEGRHS